MELEIKLIDYDRVMKAVENLSNIDKNKVIKQGLRDATALYIRAGRSNLKSRMKNPKGVTGNLIGSFKNKVKRLKLGALAGFDGFGAHAHLVNDGTVERFTKQGYARGKMTANHFWTDAISANENSAIEKVYDGISRAIQNLIKI